MNLGDVTIGITSFLRHGCLKVALEGLHHNFEDCDIIVADDSDGAPLRGLYGSNARLITMPFDSGLPAKRNLLVEQTMTKYFLLGSDDFIFDAEARTGVEKMVEVLDRNQYIDVVAGRVNNNPYEGLLDYVPGESIQESRGYYQPQHGEIYRVDIAANYFLARTDQILAWDESLKIGGEHVMWFLEMMKSGFRVIWVPGININTQPYDAEKQDPRYNKFRARAIDGHKKMKEILNIKQYIDFNGAIS